MIRILVTALFGGLLALSAVLGTLLLVVETSHGTTVEAPR